LTQIHSPLIIGHRGASAVIAENTLLAFKQAIDDGAAGIEFDVRLSRDEIPVVIHDSSLKRTGLLDVEVSDLTVAELQKINVAAFFRNASFCAVPTLAQVFELFRENEGLLYLEMKGEPVGETLIRRVCSIVEEHQIASQVIVECFDHEAIKFLKGIAPHVRTAALFESRLRRPSNLTCGRVIAAAHAAKADELALHYTLVTERLVTQAIEEGFEVVVWTVDNPKWIRRAKELGIKSLITNDPAKMLAHRANKRV
jgi:glycerophosphoryl diester phosphodiesterase